MLTGGTSQVAIENPLKDYQDYAAKWLLDRLYTRDYMGAGLFLDPGLGKTRISLTVLDFLLRLGEVRRALILAPLRPAHVVWPGEIRKWGFNFSWISLYNQHRQAFNENCKVEILNPESLHKIADIHSRWDLLLVDESTWFKTWSTKRTKLLRGLLPSIPKRIILTGTPAANSLADLHSQMYIVDNGESLGKTVGYFRSAFMHRGGYQNHQWFVTEGMGGQILSAVEGKVLRMKAEDHLDMPKLVNNDIWCELPPKCVAEYKRLKRELFLELSSGEVHAASQGAVYAKCRQYANGTVYSTEDTGGVNPKTGKPILKRTSHPVHDAKIDALEELSEELGGKPLLIAYQFDHDYTRCAERKMFKNAPQIKGGTKKSETESILERWNQGKIRHLFCQCQAVSHGINMQEACNDVAWFGLTDMPEVYEQFFRRVYRLGVKGDQVRIHRLLVRDTLEQTILERNNGKFQTQAEFLEGLKAHAKSS